MGHIAAFYSLILYLSWSFRIVSIQPLPLTGQFRAVGQISYAHLSISRTPEAGPSTSALRKALISVASKHVCW